MIDIIKYKVKDSLEHHSTPPINQSDNKKETYAEENASKGKKAA